MCPNSTDNMSGRINVRTPGWIEQYMDLKSRRESEWSNSSEVAREMIEKGVVLSELAKMGDGKADSPVLEWSRLRGIFPGDDMLVCPSCTHSNKFLFRLRNHYGKDGIQCLVCGRFDAEEEFKEDMPDDHHWASSVMTDPKAGHHIVSNDTSAPLCEENMESVGPSFGDPEPEERPERICGVCWDMNRRGMF